MVAAALALLPAALRSAPVYETVAKFEAGPRRPYKASLFRNPDGNFYGVAPGGDYRVGTLFKVTPAGAVTVLHHFSGTDGSFPDGTLVSDDAGNLWGTSDGGVNGCGTVFKFNVASGVFTTVASLPKDSPNYHRGPAAGLTNDAAGDFWGTTPDGGSSGYGTIFRVNATTGEVTPVLEFSKDGALNRGSGPQAELVADGTGFLWGSTAGGGPSDKGTIFKVEIATGVLTTVVDFTGNGTTNKGSNPIGAMVNDGHGFLWGTTSGGITNYGTVFKLEMSTGGLTTVAELTYTSGLKKGAGPLGALVADGAGYIWGTTSYGGAPNWGTVFKINTLTAEFTTVQEFQWNYGAVRGSGPNAGLVADGAGQLWGTVERGGSNNYGGIFKIDAVTGAFTSVVEFQEGVPGRGGRAPHAPLIADAAGNLWGTGYSGGHGQSDFSFPPGDNGAGAVFKLDLATGAIMSVVEFTGMGGPHEGALVAAGLASDGAGSFWGVTGAGGPNGAGTIFKIDIASGAHTTVVEFTGTAGPNRGAAPYAALLSDGHGNFWGTTYQGGQANLGTVFKINATTGVFTTVIEFTGKSATNKGSLPHCTLASDGVGNLWGTTASGGAADFGTVFKINEQTGELTTIVEFTGSVGPCKGNAPFTGLLRDDNGNFWGTTTGGGFNGSGTVFHVSGTGEFTNVVDFGALAGPNSGWQPFAGLINDGSGHFLGTTAYGGASNAGTLFSIDASTGALTTLFSFASGSVTGSDPLAALFRHSDGNFYAVTASGAQVAANIDGPGEIFRLRYGPTPVTLPADGVTVSAATLHGSIAINGKPTAVSFEYGTSPTLSDATNLSLDTILGGDGATPVNTSLGALQPATTYYFRTVGSNADNSVPQRGAILSFTTSGCTIAGSFSPVIVPTGPALDYTGQAVTAGTAPITVTQEPPAGTILSAGTTTFTLTATDGAENTANTSFDVNVRPTSPRHDVLFAAGEAAPVMGVPGGPPADALLASFGVPAIDDNCNVAFTAKWTSETDGSGSGLFVNSKSISVVGGPVPNLPDVTYESFADPVVDGGHVASIVRLAGVAKSNSAAVLSWTSATGGEIIAQAGSIATPGGATFKSFKSVAVLGEYTAFLAHLTPKTGTKPKTTEANNVGLWVKDGAEPLLLVLREGQTISTAGAHKTIKTLISFAAGAGSPGCGRGWLIERPALGAHVLALCLFTDKSQAVVQVDVADMANPIVLSQTGLANGTGSPSIADATFASYSVPSASTWMRCFLASLAPSEVHDITKANARGIFADFGATSFAAVARTGDLTGLDDGTTFGQFKDPVLGDDGGLAFAATLDGATGLSRNALWWKPPGATTGGPANDGLLLLARAGQSKVPDVSSLAQWKNFPSLAIATNRGPIFAATLLSNKGGVTAGTANGVWAVDFNGNLQLLFRTGDMIDLGGGATKTLKSFTLLSASKGSTGVRRGFNGAQQVVWRATFKEDKSQAIIVTDVP